jgi:prolyl-tRNA editing enzyme YbaK/EbsC (Cys-tRNA(Pro) deacylase)
MRGPMDVTRELLAVDVTHEIVHLPRRIDDAAELPEVLGLPGEACVAVRLYDADGALVAALLPADRAAATTALARAVAARAVRPAAPGRVIEATDSHPALVPPVGLPAGVALVADAALHDVVYAPTGDGSTALKIRRDDLLHLTGASLAALVEPGAVLALGPRAAEDDWRLAARR